MSGNTRSRRAPGRAAGILIALALLLPASRAAAQSGAPDGGVDGNHEQAAADSPRVSLEHYLDLCRDGAFEDAARYLDVPEALAERRAQLAQRLKHVLDRHVWIDLNRVSPLSGGDPSDGLGPGTDELGRIPAGKGELHAVRLVRHADQEEARWVFSRATVGRIDAWYGQLEHRWLLDRLPRVLLRPGLGELLWWQWLALPFLLLAAWGMGYVLGRLTRGIAGHVVRRTASAWDDRILTRIAAPMTLACTVAAAYFLLPFVGLYAPARLLVYRILRTGLAIAFFWALLRCVDVMAEVTSGSGWARVNPASRALIPLGSRILKLVLLAIAMVAVLAALDYSVVSLIAGLGIGGLAIALAAQKTVENLFGTFSIGIDQPFREGDVVKIEDCIGTVETIGLRSTRIRTPDRTIVTLPNGKLADTRVESFTARDRLRLFCTLGLVYGTTVAQVREVLEGLERVLRAHPKIWADEVVVRFKELADSALVVEVTAWFTTVEWNEFRAIRQDVLLQFMEVVERAGTSFAFPTRTVHLVSDGGAKTKG